MDIRSVFGLNMRRLRLAAGLNQEDAADSIGIGRAHASAMERGRQNATLLILEKVAEAFGCRPAELLDEGAARAFAQSHAASKIPRKRRKKRR